VASIGLAGPLHRLNSEMSRRFGQLVLEAAQRAERRLGRREDVE
jgi:DNA-binding IclR family transcriptional regulator